MTETRPWQILVVGSNDQEAAVGRMAIRDEAMALGFDVHVWYENPEIDPATGTDGSCVRAVLGTQIVVAILTARGGSAIRADRRDLVAPADVDFLRRSNILPPVQSSATLPTVLHVEVLTAKAVGRPLIVFAHDALLQRVDQAIQQLAADLTVLEPAVPSPEDASTLIHERRWRELAFQFRPKQQLNGLEYVHVMFVKRVMDEGPNNWVESVSLDAKDVDRLKARLGVGLQRIPLSLLSPDTLGRVRDRDPQIGAVERGLDRARSPLVPESLRRLLEDERLIDPPYAIDGVPGTAPLSEALVSALRDRRSVLLVGEPGLGKSTTCLATAAQFRAGEDLAAYGRWRELADDTEVLASLIGAEYLRREWPLEVPTARWVAVVDGLDESTRELPELVDLVSRTVGRGDTALLCSVREGDYYRRFASLNNEFDHIVELRPWSSQHVTKYVDRLRHHERHRAADYVERHVHLNRQFISYPLWLSILGYLAERSGSVSLAELNNDIAALRMCARAVAEEECERHGLPPDEAPSLERLWERAAWELRKSGQPLSEDELFRRVGLPLEASWIAAFRSVLEPFSVDRVSGFFHEVFQEFWLAQHVAGVVMEGAALDVLQVFGVWRSRLTNQILRGRLAVPESRQHAAAVLRRAYREATDADDLTKNQVLYVVGRIDDTAETRSFLRGVWRDENTPVFARYSAAFAAAIAGEETVERDFAEALENDSDLDSVNRGYHRVYYGDVPGFDERSLPFFDRGDGSAQLAIEALTRRLSESEVSNRRLRRIELLTLRRLIETHQDARVSDDIAGVVSDAVQPPLGFTSEGFSAGLQTAAQKLRDVVAAR